MGVFDSVWIACEDCGEDIELQSKAGPCGLIDYKLHDAPPSVLGDLDGRRVECKCGWSRTVRVHTMVFLT